MIYYPDLNKQILEYIDQQLKMINIEIVGNNNKQHDIIKYLIDTF